MLIKKFLIFGIVSAGLILTAIRIPILTLLLGYIVIPTALLFIVFLSKDLTNGLIFWLCVLLFSGVGIWAWISHPTLPDISLDRVIWITVFAVFFAEIAMRRRKILPITKIEMMMILFCIVCLISMVKAGTIYEEGQGLVLRSFLNGYAIPFSIFFIGKNIVDNEQRIKRLFQFLLLIGIYLALTGIFEHFRFTSLVFPRYIMDPDVGIHFGRARGPFLQAEVNGTVLVMIFVVNVYFLIHKRWGISKVIYIIFTGLMVITMFFTYTRACWLGFILSILIVPLFYPRLRKIFLLCFFVIVIIAILNWDNVMSEDRTVGGVTAMDPVYARINLYAASLSMFLDRPILGFGFNTFQNFSPDYFHKISGIPLMGVGLVPHDTLAGILVELGLLGLITLLLIFFYVFRNSVKLYRSLYSKPFLGKGLVVTFWGLSIAFFVNMQFVEMRYFQFPNSLFFLVAGIIVGLNQRLLLNKVYKK